MGKKTKVIISFTTMAVLAFITFLFLRITQVNNMNELQLLIEDFGVWSWVAFLILQVVVTSILSFVPATSFTFLSVGIIVFGPVGGFIIGSIGVFISSMLMFVIGRKFGLKFAIWLVGKEKFEKVQDKVTGKTKTLLPVMFTLPFFPEDALCMMAGMTKMKYTYFALIVIIFRSVGVAFMAFLGSGILDFTQLGYIEWFMLINLLIFDFVVIWRYVIKLEQVLRKRKERKEKREAKGIIVKDPSLIKELLAEKTYIIVKDEKQIKEIEKKINK